MISEYFQKRFGFRSAVRQRRRVRPVVEQCEDRTVPSVLDLTGGTTSGFLNGGLFQLMNQQPAGSGVIDSFVRIHATGCCDTTPEGHNTSGRNPGSPKLNFDENSSPVFTHNLQLRDVPRVQVDSRWYREFRLDFNEPNNNPAVPVSLNKVKIFTSATGSLLATPPNLGTLGTLRWDMDGGTASAGTTSGADQDAAAPSANGNWVKMNDRNHGSGQADMRLLVPESAFNGVQNDHYIYLFSRFGDTLAMSGGYEEWYVGPAARQEAVNVVTRIDRELPGGGEEQGPIGSVFNVPLGSVVHDHSFVTPADGTGAPTGTVAYSFWTNGTCSGDPVRSTTVALGSQSPSEGPLAAGDYSFAARYSGDGSFSAGTAECEPLHVNKGTLTLTTVMHDAAHGLVNDGGHVPLGTVMHDNAALTGAHPSFAPTGAVSFTLTGPSSNTLTTLPGEAGFYATSSNSVALVPGNYAFNASYAGDSNYNAIASGAHNPETFVVDKGTLTLTTVMHNAAHGQVNDGGHVPLGTMMHDNAALTGAHPSFAPTGAVTFTLTGPGGTSTLATAASEAGFYATSADSAALAAGNYAFNASYAGDSNYNAIASGAHNSETFVVDKANVNIRTEVHNNAHQDITNTIVLNGTPIHDAAFVTGQVGAFGIGGTVTYRFYDTNDCTGSSTSETVAVGSESSVLTPSGGFHSYCATYDGDANYNGSVGAPEPFTVLTRQNGRTPGFWSNQNGEAALNSLGMDNMLALLRSYNLKDDAGNDFDPTTYAQLQDFLLGTNATNMAGMLSRHLAATVLNVQAGFVSGSGLVYVPLFGLTGNTGPGNQFRTVNDLIGLANAELGLHPTAFAGDPWRTFQEQLKNALAAINQNDPVFLP